MAAKDELGKRGEQLAARYLSESGFEILDRNWRCNQGELDLVAREGDELVFVEVKTRQGTAYGHPFEAITTQKLARLHRLAVAWCDAHPEHIARMRIDAIAVIAPRESDARIEHLRRVL